ncbi:hypothetical protein LTR66_004535 [Elasticomyces elasticus]|nr:hypothetical protein LTR66_004535 [Elasticomyces elasticus]
MAYHHPAAPAKGAPVVDVESDYGSDFDESALTGIVASIESQPPNPPTPVVLETSDEDRRLPRRAFILKPPSGTRARAQRYVDDEGVPFDVLVFDGPLREPSVEVEYDEVHRTSWSAVDGDPSERQRTVSVEPESIKPDNRTPLERFRTAPKKPLSVTDMVSPAWCELQYWYTLTKYGRKKRTPAMRQGSKVHKVLEEQVHKTVPIDTQTREDAFALRIWNIVQGLRTLRITGMTREFEIWGVIEGQVINGVIDELSFTCPDELLELSLVAKAEELAAKVKKTKPLPANQRTMESIVTTSTPQEDVGDAWPGTPTAPLRRVYLTDIKTRGSKTMPSGESGLRPTFMQLMLYHRILSLLASNAVPAEQIFARYRLDGNAFFSTAFIEQIGSLDLSFRDNLNTSDEDVAPSSSSQGSVDELLAHNSLKTLWELMMQEFQKTLPSPPSTSPNLTPAIHPAIGSVLRAEFRTSTDGRIIGSRTFAYDPDVLDRYLQAEMAWWKGEREAKGVEIEEAYKCRICEFADGCTWREQKIEEATKKARLREGKGKGERRRSEV